MSFTFAVVVPPVAADDRQAWAELDGLIAQPGPPPAVFHTLLSRLTARYPDPARVPDELIDDCVWSDGPLEGNLGHRATVLGIVWSRAEEAFPFVVETATGLGLTVFDWRSDGIHRP